MSKVVLITGASRGIGREIARLAGEQKWSVGVNYAGDANAASATVVNVKTSGGQAIAIQGDVSREEDVISMFDQVEEALGPLDAVVNNAGIVGPACDVADMELSRMQRIFDVNVTGAFLCASEAARRMAISRGGKGGSIVNISSIAARLGSPNEYVDYAASKAAVDTLTMGLAKELAGDGVRVNAVRPGLIETDIHASGGDPDRAHRLGATTPMGRPGSPHEIASLVMWLLGDDASYTTGALMDVSGGR